MVLSAARPSKLTGRSAKAFPGTGGPGREGWHVGGGGIRRPAGVLPIDHPHRGNGDDIPGTQDVLLDFSSVHLGSAGRAEIEQYEAAIPHPQLGMRAGDMLVLQNDLVVYPPADIDHRTIQ